MKSLDVVLQSMANLGFICRLWNWFAGEIDLQMLQIFFMFYYHIQLGIIIKPQKQDKSNLFLV